MSANYNLRLLAPLAGYFADRDDGKAAFAKICNSHGVEESDLAKDIHWVSFDVIEAILAEAHDAIGNEAEFYKACAHRMIANQGALAMLGWGMSPRLVYAIAPKAGKSLTTAGAFEVVSTTSRSARLRYTSKFAESRLLCISRQAQSAALPGFFGLPEAHVREHSCIARGDAACEYEFVWVNRRKVTLPLLATALGALCAYLIGAHVGSFVYAIPVIAGLLGYIFEKQTVQTSNEKTATDIADALRARMADEAEARSELQALQERSSHWTRLVEQARNDRQSAIDQVAEKINELQAEKNSTLLGLGHDLRNPLTVISANLELLRETQLSNLQRELSSDMFDASTKMAGMLREMMGVLRAQAGVSLHPADIRTQPLVDSIKRRAQALVFGKDIRITVFANRECPELINIDRTAFDRIVDNLLSNASKYTDRGSVVIELDGVPNFFVLKIGDTGRGIDNDQLNRVFTSGGSRERDRAPDSYGVGLSSVVELLSRMGGRLEVMSRVAKGTTFWVYLPIRPTTDGKLFSIDERKTGKHLLHVVQVRKHPA